GVDTARWRAFVRLQRAALPRQLGPRGVSPPRHAGRGVDAGPADPREGAGCQGDRRRPETRSMTDCEAVMRSVLLAPICVVALGLCAYLSSKPDEPAKIRLRLVDAATGKDVGGMVRVFPVGKDEPLRLPGLFDRLRGLTRSQDARGWYVVPARGAETTLPRARLRIEAVSGLESALARQEIDLSEKAPTEVVGKLSFVFRPGKEGLSESNARLHRRDLSAQDADEYLRQTPAADGLKVMFISYLERKDDDRTYISNRYPVGELKQFRGTGVLFNNGEEHRHNFQAYGQGYGHVM